MKCIERERERHLKLCIDTKQELTQEKLKIKAPITILNTLVSNFLEPTALILPTSLGCSI